jgi:hypothetical protein
MQKGNSVILIKAVFIDGCFIPVPRLLYAIYFFLKTCHVVHIKSSRSEIGFGQGFFLIDLEIDVHREALSFSEGELLEPQQMMLPQGVGPSTSAGHIQVQGR